MSPDRPTLARFLAAERRRRPALDAGVESVLLDVAAACAAIAAHVRAGELGGAGRSDRFLDAFRHNTFLAGLVSEEIDDPVPLRSDGRFLLLVDPLDGASNIDVNVPVGSIFAVLRAPEGAPAAAPSTYLQPGAAQVAAGYAMYGPATVLVLSLGRGVHVFTLDPVAGHFVLTREAVRIPRPVREFAINAANRRFWEPGVRRYVDECLMGRAGPRHHEFTMRWIGSLVAEVHRVLTRGGVFLYPRDGREPLRPGRLRLLYEANPVAFLVEQAGGAASTGRQRVLDIVPADPHERAALIFGAPDEVARIERFHRMHNDHTPASPLYGERGLFRRAAG